MEIRKDLKDIENELNRAVLIAQKLQEYDEHWVHDKNQEDMRDIYQLPHHLYSPLEQVYAEGRQMARSFAYALCLFNNVEEHSTIYSWVKSLEENWIKNSDYYKGVVEKAEQTQINIGREYNSINQMIHTLKNQIKLLDQTAILLTIIKGKSIYLIEESAINHTEKSSIELPVENEDSYDVFISHASEDKADYVEPLCAVFESEGIKIWYDKNEILWGDSIVRKINQGLSKSKYAIVVLSLNFIQKNWPTAELEAILNIETSKGEVRVLPLLIGNKDEISSIIDKYPLVAGKRYLKYEDGNQTIVNSLKERLKSTR
ncbi:MAG: toll/interleukin-1 receptor domain-containing protein [Crocinitomicaceae bacterium]